MWVSDPLKERRWRCIKQNMACLDPSHFIEDLFMAILNVYINYSIFEGSILRYFKANVGHMMEVFDHDEQHSETQDEQRSQTM